MTEFNKLEQFIIDMGTRFEISNKLMDIECNEFTKSKYIYHLGY